MPEVASLEAVLRLRDETSAGLRKASATLHRAGQQMQSVGRGLTMGLTVPLAAVGGVAVKAASDFESSFAGVRKTVEATEEQFAELAGGIRAMALEIPASVEELNRIAEAGGQLGIATEHLEGFTRVIADMAVTTNLTADEAATAFARIANITGLSQTQFENLGSVVVALGNNLATTEKEIAEFALRIAASGTIAGLTEAQILAIGGAMTSVGVRAERGGTAVQKVLTNMVQAVAEGGEKVQTFAEVTGQSAEAFAESFRTDAAGTFTSFVEGLGQQGDAAFATLEKLELQDQRLIQSFLSLAGAGDLLRNSMDLGTKAFAENTALTEEAEKRYVIFESQMGLLKNKLKDIAITLGQALLPVLRDLLAAAEPVISWVSQMAERFADLSPETRKMVVVIAALAAAIGPLMLVLGILASVLGTLLSPIGLVVVGIAALAIGIATHMSEIRAAVEAVQRFWAEAWRRIGEVLSVVLRFVIERFNDFGEALEFLVNGVISGVNLVITAINKLPGVAITALGKVDFQFDQLALSAIDGLAAIRAAIADLIPDIGGEFQKLAAEPVISWLSQMAEGFAVMGDKGAEAAKNVTAAAGEIADAVHRMAASTGQTNIQALRAKVAGFRGALDQGGLGVFEEHRLESLLRRAEVRLMRAEAGARRTAFIGAASTTPEGRAATERMGLIPHDVPTFPGLPSIPTVVIQIDGKTIAEVMGDDAAVQEQVQGS